MKYAIVIPDGAADRPIEALGGRTPLEVARLPNMDRIAAGGRLGTVKTIPRGLAPGSDVAILSLLGYDPRKCYTGRAGIEAAARSIALEEGDWVFRCNLVTVADEEMVDYSAGHVTTKEATLLIDALQQRLGSDAIRFYAGIGYRHLVVFKGARFKVETAPPHDIMGYPTKKYLPRGKNAKQLTALMDASREVLAEHPVNKVRRDLGEPPATQIWLWGQGQKSSLRPFHERWGLKGAAITGVDLVRGIAMLIGWDLIAVEGATAYYDTNYAGKGQAAIETLKNHDLVLVHVEATDEAGHNGDARQKVRSLEQIDTHIVGPLLDALQEAGEFRFLVSPDHETPVELRTHETRPVPFAMMGTGLDHVRGEVMTEREAASAGFSVSVGHELMEYFLTR